jgi:DNA-binding HxlR family transcriptional regulator
VTRQREYHQACGVAKSLDVLGERWSLLIVRELLLGPKRYGQLQAVFPGLSPTLLSERLKGLVAADIAESRRLPPPANVQAYALTERGEGLRPTVESLAIWGFDSIQPERIADGQDRGRASWLAFTAAAFGATTGNATSDTVAQFDIDGDQFVVETRDGRAWVRHGVADRADVEVEATLNDWWRALHGAHDLQRVTGDTAALDAALQALSLTKGH